MPRHGKLSEHLSVAALEQRYRQANDPLTRSHFHILWLRAQGQTTPQVAAVTGYSPHWIRTLVARYNAGGPEAMGDQRHHNPGGQWLLSPEQKAQLDQALEHPPADGGLWTSTKVAAWMRAATGRNVHPQRGWDYLRLLGYTPQVPRPRHAKADPHAQEAFKKNASGVRNRD
jgi:transposase